jgi:hypothetical protein
MAADGYRLALLEDATGTGRTVAAFRVLQILHAGQMLDVDDFVPDSARRSLAPAIASSTGSSPTRAPLGCDSFVVDAGTQHPDTHRFSLWNRMKISCCHCERPLLP